VCWLGISNFYEGLKKVVKFNACAVAKGFPETDCGLGKSGILSTKVSLKHVCPVFWHADISCGPSSAGV